MVSRLEAELVATCNALGYLEDGHYHKDPDCLEALKDLILYLKHDQNAHEIRRWLGHCEILKTDLIPLVKLCWKHEILFDVLLRLLVNLTNPALLLFQESPPDDKLAHSHYMELLGYLQNYKKWFVDNKLFAIFTQKLSDILKLDWERRQEKDKLTMERILILVRNVLHVPLSDENRTDNDANTHDQLLWTLNQSGFSDLLLFLTSSEEENSFAFHVLEIISLMFREQNPQQLASAGLLRSRSEKHRDEHELLQLQLNANVAKQQNVKKFLSNRHSMFGGTYYVNNIKSISDNIMISHRPLRDTMVMKFDVTKNPIKLPRNRQPMKENDLVRRSTLSIRLFLKEFCNEFLENSYNPLMKTVKNFLMHQVAGYNDDIYYLWSLKFFMEFNRCANSKVEYVSETMSINSFHYVQTQIDKCREMFITDKKNITLWSRRLHMALNAYKELLFTLAFMDQSPDISVCETAKIIKGNIIYSVEYRELPLILIHSYDELRMSKLYLRDLIEVIHIFFKIVEKHSKHNSHLIAQKQKRNRCKRRKFVKNEEVVIEISEEQLQKLWDELCNDLSLILQKPNVLVQQEIIPFDPLDELNLENQKVKAMYDIQQLLHKKQVEDAVALFRVSRDIWPEAGAFGTIDMKPEDEFLALREIHFTSLSHLKAQLDNYQNLHSYDAVSEEEQEELRQQKVEQQFNFPDFVKQFASHRVIKPYCLLLQFYHKNSSFTNHCIVKMLHRVSYDFKMPGFLYQASVFRTFQKVLSEYTCNENSPYKEISRFACYILQSYFTLYKSNPKIGMELLFWKNSQEVYEMEEGYGTYKKKSKSTKQLWTEENDDELQRLFGEYKDVKDENKDVLDFIMENMIDQSKTRRQVMMQLKRLNLLFLEPKKPKRTIQAAVRWTKEEEFQLQSLYAKHKDSNSVLQQIMNDLTVQRPKTKIIEKLLELGVVSNRKLLYTKYRKNIKFSNNQTNPEKTKVNRKNSSNSDNSEMLGDETGNDAENEEVSNGQEITLESNELLNLCDSLVNSYKASLLWIKDTLFDVANDRGKGDDNGECTPLVPFTKEMAEAMEDYQFLTLLKAIGIRAPQNEQETYWRIPSVINSISLQKWATFLNGVLNGTISSADNLQLGDYSWQNLSKSSIKRNKNNPPKKLLTKKSRKKKFMGKRLQEMVSDSSDDETLASWKNKSSVSLDSSTYVKENPNSDFDSADRVTVIDGENVYTSEYARESPILLQGLQKRKKRNVVISSDENETDENYFSSEVTKKKVRNFVLDDE